MLTTSENIVIDNEYATLMYIPELNLVRHKFHQPIYGQPFRQVIDRGVELLIEHGARKWLSDDRANMAFPDDDMNWILNDWIPRALAAGWKFWALVVPEDILARGVMGELIDGLYERGLRMMVFSKPEEALEWIASVG